MRRYESGCRTVIIRNLTVFVQYKNVVEMASRCGQILSLNLERKDNRASCFVNFLETDASKIFYMALSNKHLRFENQENVEFIKGKPIGVHNAVVQELERERGRVSRNIEVGGLSTLMKESQVKAMFQSYTTKLEFQSVKMIQPGVALVKCLSIQDAVRIRNTFDGQNMLSIRYDMDELKMIDLTDELVSQKAVDVKGLLHFERQLPKSIHVDGTLATKEQLFNVPVVGFITPNLGSDILGKPLVLMRQEDRHAFPPSLDIYVGAPPRIQLPEGEPSRGIYIGFLSSDATYRDVCRLGNSFGKLEFVKIIPVKSCAFINFIHLQDAKKMYKLASKKAISLHKQRISVGWAKTSPLRPDIENLVRDGATRNLYLSNLSQDVSENFIMAMYKSALMQTKGGIGFAKEHFVESLVINRERGFAFLNTTSVLGAVAMKTRYGENCRIGNQHIRISYAKERISMCSKLDRVVSTVVPSPMNATQNMGKTMMALQQQFLMVQQQSMMIRQRMMTMQTQGTMTPQKQQMFIQQSMMLQQQAMMIQNQIQKHQRFAARQMGNMSGTGSNMIPLGTRKK